MPFTLAHPAIVLPLTYLPRRWFSFTGLVVGSMTPDMEYVLRMRILSEFSHTMVGVFWFDIPVGILLAFVFHNIIRDGLINHLPVSLKGRLASYKNWDWNAHFLQYWFVVVVSLGIGAVSHIVWDSFTHANGFVVQSIPVLTDTINMIGISIPMYKVLQHGSSLIGCVLIARVVYDLPYQPTLASKSFIHYWSVFTTVLSVILLLRFALYPAELAVGNAVVSGLTASLAGLVVASRLVSWNYDG